MPNEVLGCQSGIVGGVDDGGLVAILFALALIAVSIVLVIGIIARG